MSLVAVCREVCIPVNGHGALRRSPLVAPGTKTSELWRIPVLVCNNHNVTVSESTGIYKVSSFYQWWWGEGVRVDSSPRWLCRCWELRKILASVQVFWLPWLGLFNHSYNVNMEEFWNWGPVMRKLKWGASPSIPPKLAFCLLLFHNRSAESPCKQTHFAARQLSYAIMCNFF